MVQEKTVTSSGTKYITFLYNGEGLTGFVYDNTLYTYRKNLLGDIIAVYQGSTKVAEYVYDAYGKCTVMLNTAGIATINPFRYRSYYFDSDLGLYYLQSRYYDPETGRFINADDVSYLDPETIHGLNLYAYCLNNPVMYVDPSGNMLISTIILLACIGVGVLAGATYAGVTAYNDGARGWELVGWTALGAVVGGLIGGFIGYFAGPIITSLLGAGGGLVFAGGVGSSAGIVISETMVGTLATVGAISVTAAGSALAASGIVMFAKGTGPRMGHNQHEKQMWNEALRKIGVKDNGVRRILHDQIHHYPYRDNLKDLIQTLEYIIEKLGINIR